MARLLLTALRVPRRGTQAAMAALLALAVAGCPHDWSSYESVATDEPRAESTPTTPGPTSDDASAPAPPGIIQIFVTSPDRPTLVEADAEGIVFATTGGSVNACSHDDCASPRSIATLQHDLRGLAVDDGFVAWAARGDHVVRRTSRSTPGPAQEVDENDGLVAVAVTTSRLYFAVDAVDSVIGTPGIRSCRPGIDCQDLTLGTFAEGRVTAMRFAGPDAFWLGEAGVVGCPIVTCDEDAAKRTVLAAEPVLPTALAVDGEAVYYVSANDGGSLRAVSRLGVTSGAQAAAAPRVLARDLGVVTRLAVTRSSVWLTRSGAGTVSRVPRTGGALVEMARDLATPTGITHGGGYVYVACTGDGRILRWKED